MSRGFSLVEVIIAIVIFSAVILSLAGLAFQIARRGTRATDHALSMAAMKAAADKVAAVPYDSLAQILRADTMVSGAARIIVTYRVDSLSATTKNVTIVATSSVAGSKPDTLVISRGRFRYPIPLR